MPPQNLAATDGVTARAFALGALYFTAPNPFRLHLAKNCAPLPSAAARASEEGMKELAGKNSLQAVVDAALAASAARHAAAKALCARLSP